MLVIYSYFTGGGGGSTWWLILGESEDQEPGNDGQNTAITSTEVQGSDCSSSGNMVTATTDNPGPERPDPGPVIQSGDPVKPGSSVERFVFIFIKEIIKFSLCCIG